MENRVITIAINGSIADGPSWDAIQSVVRSMTNDDEGIFTRIHRRDLGANYRASSGVYDVAFRSGDDIIDVVLTVNKGVSNV